MRIRAKEIRRLHKRREDRYKLAHRGEATAVAPATPRPAAPARPTGGRTGGPAAPARPPRKPAPRAS